MTSDSLRAVRIAPDFARALLEMNTRNRPKTRSKIKEYAEEMKANKWKLNGETIKITEDGTILDGQHRLEACILSDTPFDTYIVNVADATSFDTIDIGRKRTVADTLSVRGEAHAKVLAHALSLLYDFTTLGEIRISITNKKTGVLESMLEKYPELRDSVAFAVHHSKACDALMSRAGIAVCHYLFSGLDAAQANTFVLQVLEGENIKKGDPAWILRNRLLTERMQTQKGTVRTSYLIALTIKAWNAYRKGRAISSLKFGEGEGYPIPI
jgi:hypothetical protein